ncbi:MAG: type II toxin-antitoxin system RelE/ParE family toxin [Ignavibacteria bacterium]|nr:type II toxin-antitoxin system RelE/ParE family toxin [Ignavibacteria bacterium]
MKISLTKRAEKKYRLIKEYIRTEWGVRVESAFEQRAKDFFDLLKDFPKQGPLEIEEKQIRGIMLTKHTKIFYRIKGNRIIILTFFDVRQDPSKKFK